MLRFKVLFEDDAILVVDKPAGFHTHPPEDQRVRISPRWNGLRILETQIGLALYPAHRLDRATSGLLLLSKQRELNGIIQEQFRDQSTEKTYFALVRGRFLGPCRIDRPLDSEIGDKLPSITQTDSWIRFELPIKSPTGSNREFTLISASPITGRFHQIRRHLSQVGFPILGDRSHGDKKLNREFANLTQIDRLLLRCMELKFKHPITKQSIVVRAKWSRDWHALFEKAGACPFSAKASPFPRPLSLS